MSRRLSVEVKALRAIDRAMTSLSGQARAATARWIYERWYLGEWLGRYERAAGPLRKGGWG